MYEQPEVNRSHCYYRLLTSFNFNVQMVPVNLIYYIKGNIGLCVWAPNPDLEGPGL